jgi:hypothetical protein
MVGLIQIEPVVPVSHSKTRIRFFLGVANLKEIFYTLGFDSGWPFRSGKILLNMRYGDKYPS